MSIFPSFRSLKLNRNKPFNERGRVLLFLLRFHHLPPKRVVGALSSPGTESKHSLREFRG